MNRPMTVKTGYLKAPCKDCEERYLGCHGKCNKYKAFKESNEERNKHLRMLKEERVEKRRKKK